NRSSHMLTKVNLATFQHRQGVGPNRLKHLHLYIGEALRVAAQEIRKDAFDHLRGARHLQDTRVPPPEHLRPLVDSAGVVQETAAVAEQLLTLAGQQEPASYTIEKFETEILLQIADLSGQRRLGNAQAQ